MISTAEPTGFNPQYRRTANYFSARPTERLASAPGLQYIRSRTQLPQGELQVGSLAKWVHSSVGLERFPSKEEVAGSSPAGPVF